ELRSPRTAIRVAEAQQALGVAAGDVGSPEAGDARRVTTLEHDHPWIARPRDRKDVLADLLWPHEWAQSLSIGLEKPESVVADHSEEGAVGRPGNELSDGRVGWIVDLTRFSPTSIASFHDVNVAADSANCVVHDAASIGGPVWVVLLPRIGGDSC